MFSVYPWFSGCQDFELTPCSLCFYCIGNFSGLNLHHSSSDNLRSEHFGSEATQDVRDEIIANEVSP